MRSRTAWDCSSDPWSASTGEAATAAFDRYLTDRGLSSRQLHFVQLIVEHPTANGVVEVSALYESPFTDNAPQGPDMIFSEEQVDSIVVILNDVRRRALPDAVVACPPRVPHQVATLGAWAHLRRLFLD
ncbi:MAG: type restriction enzyme subunit [Frankiaceae bacterium]|nr:type restriction enzyme subunit [Frankiaceae bacterium]